jgi:hypothetical protein
MTRCGAGHRAAPLRSHQAPTLPRPGIETPAFLVAEITVVLATVVSVDASATFAVVAFAILMETFSISASMGMDIRIITRTPTRITIRILIRTTRCIEG